MFTKVLQQQTQEDDQWLLDNFKNGGELDQENGLK